MRTAGVSRPDLHEGGQVVSVEGEPGWQGHGWRYVCRCGWQGPLHAHPIDAGFDCTEHAPNPLASLRTRGYVQCVNEQEGQMTTALNATQAIRKVLEEANGPLKAGAIADLVLPMVPTLKGKTPKATIAAKLYTEAKKPDPWVTKTADGFVLASGATATRASDDDSPAVLPGSKVVRDGRKAKPNPKPSQAKAKA